MSPKRDIKTPLQKSGHEWIAGIAPHSLIYCNERRKNIDILHLKLEVSIMLGGGCRIMKVCLWPSR